MIAGVVFPVDVAVEPSDSEGSECDEELRHIQWEAYAAARARALAGRALAPGPEGQAARQ